jgi:hypothetical protein
LDGDIVVTAPPAWFEAWRAGADGPRITQDSREFQPDGYGEYVDMVDQRNRLYSGLVSLPPRQKYMDVVVDIFRSRPLRFPHDGKKYMSEQGVIAAAFGRE